MTDASRPAIINVKPIGHGLDASRDFTRLLPLAPVISNPGTSPDQVVSEGKVVISALTLTNGHSPLRSCPRPYNSTFSSIFARGRFKENIYGAIFCVFYDHYYSTTVVGLR